MKSTILYLLFVLNVVCLPLTVASSPRTCPDKILGSDSIEGIYNGVEDGDFSWLMLDVDGESMTFMADSEELEAAFGQNPVGKRIAVEYEIRQFWNEYGNECSRLNVFKSGKLAGSGLKAAHSKQVEMLFQPETLGSTIAYLEHMVGPARKINGNEREYDVDGCKVLIWGTTDIEALELEVSPRCTFDVSRFTGDNQPMPAHDLTFGLLGGNITTEFLYNWGNAFVPLIHATFVGSRASGWIDIQVTTSESSPLYDAASPWLDSMVKQRGEEWVISGEFDCDSAFQEIAQKSMRNVQAEKIKIGHDLGQQCP